ncbi:MAG: hypothetical protein AAF289_00775 [Cyanobacteria bacterium P01_A01_bin.135]
MVNLQWRSMTAALTATGVISAAIASVMGQAAVAQSLKAQLEAQPTASAVPSTMRVSQLFDSARATLSAGTPIDTLYEETDDDGNRVERVVVLPDETAPLSLTVARDVRSTAGTVVIPAGSTIEGELRPLEDDAVGTQFFSEEVTLPNGERYDIDAISAPITRTEIITEESDRDFIKGAVIGGAAAAVLAEILGDIDILEVLGGAGLGALGILIFGGGDEDVEVVVVEPEQDLDVALQSAFSF